MSMLGLDIGTSSCKAIVIDEKGNTLAWAQRGYPMFSPCPGRLELDPGELWQSVQCVVHEAAAVVERDPVSALCIATMGDSFVPVDREGRPIGNFILASDVRSTRESELLVKELGRERIFDITGMPPHPINTLTKILWLKNNAREIFSSAARYLCAEEFVVSRLGLPPTTSYSNACRTMAFDIERRRWSTEMMSAAGVTEDAFAAAVPSGEVVGRVPSGVASSLSLPRGVQVVSGGMDQACSALGAGAARKGIVEDSLGTVEAVSFTIERKDLSGTLKSGLRGGYYSVNCHVIGDKYLIMALVLSAGSTLRWFGDTFGWDSASPQESGSWNLPLTEESPAPTPLLFLPYLAGSGTPTMDPLARGMFLGLDLGTRRDDLLKAILQGIAHEVHLNFERLETLGVPIGEIRCLGGGSRSEYWLQMRADILGRTVVQMREAEAAGLGAAVLAGLGGAVWGSPEEALAQVVRPGRVFVPRTQYREFYRRQGRVYRRLYPITAELFRLYASVLERVNGDEE